MADVFVSYARTDKERVAPLVAAIESRGWTVWWDPDIAPGQEFDSQIEAELLAAGAVVVVWTPTSVGSRWVRGEAREAADRGILVPVRFDGARLPMDVRAIHTIDLDQWSGNTASGPFQDLIRALEGMTRRAPGAVSQVTAATSTGAQAAAGPQRVAICVLPFANMSGDVEQEYFSDGISEDVITDLSKVSSLAVVSRNTAFNFKGKAIDIQQVARQLKVQYVLEGSVRRAGGRVRITAQLIEAATDNHVWAERYDRDLNDIFELQDEISQAIVKALKLRLLPEEKKAIGQRGTTNLEAYNIVLMARQHYASGQLADGRKSETVMRLARAAIELDPDYAQAWALLASAQRNRSYAGGAGENGLAAATRALEIDANLAEAHAAKAGALASQGDLDAALAAIGAALALDPDSPDVNREAGRLAIHRRQYAEAARYFERAFARDESDSSSGGMMITCYTALNDPAALQRAATTTLERAEKSIQRDPTNGSVMAQLYSALLVLGQAERAKEWARRAMLMDPDNLGMRYNLACDTIVSLRDFDLALELLRPVFEKGGREQVAWFKADPDTESLRDDPRCQSMIEAAERRLGIAPATISPA